MELLRGAGYTWETEPEVSEDGAFMKEQGKGLKMPNGEPMPELEILAPSAGYDPLRSTFAIWIERWLNDVGIPVRANLTGFNIIVERINDPEGFDMWILGWGLSLYPDYLEAFFHSRNALGEALKRAGKGPVLHLNPQRHLPPDIKIRPLFGFGVADFVVGLQQQRSGHQTWGHAIPAIVWAI